jgi:hypothetical protein
MALCLLEFRVYGLGFRVEGLGRVWDEGRWLCVN